MMRKTNMASPFLKWAGGKTQLLPEIEKGLPKELKNTGFIYIEPFVGSGAVLFHLLSKFPDIKKAVINDINADLINVYQTIALHPKKLISILKIYQSEYHGLEHSAEKKRDYFYAKRDLFNARNSDPVAQAALLVFLNRTCFNGLYRVNRNNAFNVPMGSYKNPTICDADNIMAVSKLLHKVEILNGDFAETLNYAGQNTFFYFDPPYKPLNSTSSFNAYAKDAFTDIEQIRLRDFCVELHRAGHKWMLSNSDVKWANPQNNFFDDLYQDFHLKRVKATRRINSNASKRGELHELLITNYKVGSK